MTIHEQTPTSAQFPHQSNQFTEPSGVYLENLSKLCKTSHEDEKRLELILEMGDAFAQAVSEVGNEVSYTKPELDELGKQLSERISIAEIADDRIQAIVDSALLRKMVERSKPSVLHLWIKSEAISKFTVDTEESDSPFPPQLADWLLKAVDATGIPSENPLPAEIVNKLESALEGKLHYTSGNRVSFDFCGYTDKEGKVQLDTWNEKRRPPRFILEFGKKEEESNKAKYDLEEVITALQKQDLTLLEKEAPLLHSEIQQFEEMYHEGIMQALQMQMEPQKRIHSMLNQNCSIQ